VVTVAFDRVALDVKLEEIVQLRRVRILHAQFLPVAIHKI
jgi:hypothetical protein